MNDTDKAFLARYAVLVTLLVMAYVAGVTFLPLSTTGVKYADIAVPLLLGTCIGGLMGFWYGAAKNQTSQATPGATSGSLSVSTTGPGVTEVHTPAEGGAK